LSFLLFLFLFLFLFFLAIVWSLTYLCPPINEFSLSLWYIYGKHFLKLN
jgi:hypothetical protein